MILTDAGITNALNQTVRMIREGDLEQAQAGLAVLEFHRLMRPLSRRIGHIELQHRHCPSCCRVGVIPWN